MKQPANPPGFWGTVVLLLRSARRRSIARGERARQLLQQKSGRDTTDWGALGKAFAVLFMVGLNCAGAFVLRLAFESAQRAEAEQQGKIVVSQSFLEAAKKQQEYEHSPSNSGSVMNCRAIPTVMTP